MTPADLIERAFGDGVGVRLDGSTITLDGPPKAVEKWQVKFDQHRAKVVSYLREIDRNQARELSVVDKTPKIPGKNEVSSVNLKEKSQKASIPELLEYQDFPTESLPQELGFFIEQVAQSICCDPSFVALPLLAGLASAIGNSLNLQVKRGWNVPAILWCAVVAPSGSAKSVPPKKALRALFSYQSKLVKQFDRAAAEHESQLAVFEKQQSKWKASKDSQEPPPEPPTAPVCQRVVVSDSTIEALGNRLADNPRGLLALYDELSGWLGGFNRYRKGTSDESKWLEFYNAQSCIIDRASGKRPLIIDRASVSLFGTIQPSILRKHLTADYKASGLAARLLFAMPPRHQKQWSESEVDEHLEEYIEQLFARLLSIEMQVSEDGDAMPALVRMDDAARELFVRYFNRHNREQQSLDEDLYAAYSKLEEVAARIALVIHAVRYANGEVTSLYQLDAGSMASGIELTEWFKAEAKRVYSVLSEGEVAYENRLLIQWIESQGSAVSARELYRGQRAKFTCSEEAEVLLQSFVRAGLGEWQSDTPTEVGGRPSFRFHLTSYGRNPKNSNDFEGFVPKLGQEWVQ